MEPDNHLRVSSTIKLVPLSSNLLFVYTIIFVFGIIIVHKRQLNHQLKTGLTGRVAMTTLLTIGPYHVVTGCDCVCVGGLLSCPLLISLCTCQRTTD